MFINNEWQVSNKYSQRISFSSLMWSKLWVISLFSRSCFLYFEIKVHEAHTILLNSIIKSIFTSESNKCYAFACSIMIFQDIHAFNLPAFIKEIPNFLLWGLVIKSFDYNFILFVLNLSLERPSFLPRRPTIWRRVSILCLMLFLFLLSRATWIWPRIWRLLSFVILLCFLLLPKWALTWIWLRRGIKFSGLLFFLEGFLHILRHIY